jgi:hypothetical protein
MRNQRSLVETILVSEELKGFAGSFIDAAAANALRDD